MSASYETVAPGDAGPAASHPLTRTDRVMCAGEHGEAKITGGAVAVLA